MAIHPPVLYLGYVGFTVPFAFAVAALVTGRVGERWLGDTRRWTLFAWGFLTVGIGLGAWWSYEVLGWGGYWAWDPVENASLLPWLTGTAYLHSVMVQERRGMLRVWNLSLLMATFSLTIFGTFLTRSGVLDSVHSFTESPIGAWLLGGFAATVAVVLGSSPGGVTACAPPAPSTRPCRGKAPSWPTTSSSPPSPSWSCWAPSSPSSSRR
jgi:cytochrome c-type biogenesis protein CcmF